MANAAVLHGIGQSLRRQPVTLAALVAVVLLCWWYLFEMAQGMSGMDKTMVMPFQPWSADYFLLMLLMWTLMMVGMMVPSALPMILLHQRVARHQQLAYAGSGTGLFVLGYLLVWALFSLAATVLQWQLERLALLSPMMVSQSATFSAAVLMLIGVYQWTPWKESCLRWCQSPLLFLSQHWQAGAGGALRMGLRHGAYCTGCCWLLMALLLVGGIMDLTVIAAVTVLVLLEKLLPGGRRFARLLGLLSIAGGLTLLLP